MPISRKDKEDDRWWSQHRRHLNECESSNPNVLLIGDSIIQQMQYYPFWDEVMVPLRSLNCGIGGDCVQNVMYRIENGNLDRIKPKVIVLHVGTNNVFSSADEVSDAIITVINTLKEKIPEAYIIFWGLLPRGERPNKVSNKNERANKMLEEKMWDIPLTQFICSGDCLRQHPNDTISPEDMFDFLHLTDGGYRKVFTPVVKRMRELLG